MDKAYNHKYWLHDRPLVIVQNLATLDFVTVRPGATLEHDLAVYRVATVEVLQNRSASTVYRIRQSGRVYHTDTCETVYDSFEHYASEQHLLTDAILTEYAHKPPVYIARGNVITRLKSPRFEALFDKALELSSIRWIDEPAKPNDEIKKAILFLKAYTYYDHQRI